MYNLKFGLHEMSLATKKSPILIILIVSTVYTKYTCLGSNKYCSCSSQQHIIFHLALCVSSLFVDECIRATKHRPPFCTLWCFSWMNVTEPPKGIASDSVYFDVFMDELNRATKRYCIWLCVLCCFSWVNVTEPPKGIHLALCALMFFMDERNRATKRYCI